MPLLATDELRLKVAGQTLVGWSRVTLRLGLEVFPNEFTAGVSSRSLNGVDILGLPGQPFEAWLGDDKVMTGYIARAFCTMGNSTEFEIVGRGKCCDLVECSAEIPSGQVNGQSVAAIAQLLCEPYGIKVVSLGQESDVFIPQRALNYGETPYQILDWLCRIRAQLFYESAEGNLVLSPLGTVTASGGVNEGDNVEVGLQIIRAVDQRYSEVIACPTSIDQFIEQGDAGFFVGLAKDPDITRHRRLYIVAEEGDGGFEIVRRRALWEIARRKGRGQQIIAPLDSWRDSAGKLWTLNTLVPVTLPTAGIDRQRLLIAGATFTQDEKGTRAVLQLMPPDAFQPEPIVSQPVVQELK